MSQPGIGSKGSSADMPHLCSETTSQGDIYMKGTHLRHPSLKTVVGGKILFYSQTFQWQEKGSCDCYFHGTRLQVIFGLRPLVGLNPSIVSICITAFCLRIKVKCKFSYWKVEPRKDWRTSSSSHQRGQHLRTLYTFFCWPGVSLTCASHSKSDTSVWNDLRPGLSPHILTTRPPWKAGNPSALRGGSHRPSHLPGKSGGSCQDDSGALFLFKWIILCTAMPESNKVISCHHSSPKKLALSRVSHPRLFTAGFFQEWN